MSSGSYPVIDIHSHLGTPGCAELVEGFLPNENDPGGFGAGHESNEYNRKQLELLAPKLVDPAVRLADMDAMGVDIQVLAVPPMQYYYWADPALGRRLARLQNEHIAEVVASHPDRFVGVATVPLQDVEAAIAELDYGVHELGFKGVEISTNVNGRDFDDARYQPFFARIEELGALIVMHPMGCPDIGARVSSYNLANTIGMPLDSTIAISRMIHGGVFERFPELKLCVVHGGGYLPYYFSRMDHAWEVRPEARKHISRAPSSYLRQIYFDNLNYDGPHLKTLIDQMGADHVVLGTDYPYDMGYYEPLVQLGKVAGLSSDEVGQIRGATAAQLLTLRG